MIAGDPKVFAIEAEVRSSGDRWIWGGFRFWFNERPVGNWGDETALHLCGGVAAALGVVGRLGLGVGGCGAGARCSIARSWSPERILEVRSTPLVKEVTVAVASTPLFRLVPNRVPCATLGLRWEPFGQRRSLSARPGNISQRGNREPPSGEATDQKSSR